MKTNMYSEITNIFFLEKRKVKKTKKKVWKKKIQKKGRNLKTKSQKEKVKLGKKWKKKR